MTSALIATGVGKRYRRLWALRDCNIDIPDGRVVALVGPNGAGKTTLLHLAAGLLRPTVGTMRVLGRTPGRDVGLLADIGFVAQDVPLYRSFSVGDMLEFGRRTNSRWDDDLASTRIERARIDLAQRVASLSGGQRAQVGLTLALAKRPRLLLLDEPLASLDPLARREFLQSLMAEVAEGELTVVLSSHLISDLERVCDHLIVLSASRTQVAGDIDELLACHRIVVGPRREGTKVGAVGVVVQESHTDRQSTLLIRTEGPILDPAWAEQEIGLEELVLAYLGHPDATALPQPKLATADAEVSP